MLGGSLLALPRAYLASLNLSLPVDQRAQRMQAEAGEKPWICLVGDGRTTYVAGHWSKGVGMHVYPHAMTARPLQTTVTRMRENLGQENLGHRGKAGGKSSLPGRLGERGLPRRGSERIQTSSLFKRLQLPALPRSPLQFRVQTALIILPEPL